MYDDGHIDLPAWPQETEGPVVVLAQPLNLESGFKSTLMAAQTMKTMKTFPVRPVGARRGSPKLTIKQEETIMSVARSLPVDNLTPRSTSRPTH